MKIKLFSRLLMALILFVILFSLMGVMSGCNAVKKSICRQDSVLTTITIHDTTIIQRIHVDSVFSVKVDSITLVKDRLTIRYQRIRDSIYITGECAGDTIFKTKEVLVKAPCNCPPPPKPGIMDNIKYIGFGALIALALIAMLAIFKK